MGGVVGGEGINDGLVVAHRVRIAGVVVGLSEAAEEAVVVIEEEQEQGEIRRGKMISWHLILIWRTC